MKENRNEKRARQEKARQQKLMGLGMITIGVISAIAAKDATFAVIVIPIGIWLLKSKEILIY